MKVRIAHSTISAFPQFVIEAETNEEKLLLKLFIDAPDISKEELKFHLHGHSCASNAVSSFNFGWIKKQDIKPQPVILKQRDGSQYLEKMLAHNHNAYLTPHKDEAMVFDSYDQAKAFLRKCGHEVGNWILEPVNESK